jgi:hypothetical protein
LTTTQSNNSVGDDEEPAQRPRIAVLRNPSASGNKSRVAATATDADLSDNIQLVQLQGLPALTDQLAQLAQSGCDLLVVDGGDGTVREVVSRLFDAFECPPILGIMANGNTNLIARKFGRVPNLETLRGLTLPQLQAQSHLRPVLRIDRPDAPPIRGFIAGWGAYTKGTQIAVTEIAARGQGQVWRTILATARRALFGAEARAIRQGIPVTVSIPACHLSGGPRLLGLTTVFDMPLLPGIAPFWDAGDKPIRWLDIIGSPRWLWLAAPFILLGRPRAWMARAGYRSGNCDGLTLGIPGGIVVDGEVFDTQPGLLLSLSAGETVRFISI